MFDDLGLDDRTRRLTCAMTLDRLTASSSEHAQFEPAGLGRFRRTALDDLLDFDVEDLLEDPLYANMVTVPD